MFPENGLSGGQNYCDLCRSLDRLQRKAAARVEPTCKACTARMAAWVCHNYIVVNWTVVSTTSRRVVCSLYILCLVRPPASYVVLFKIVVHANLVDALNESGIDCV